MPETGGPKCYVIDRDKLHTDYPTHCHSALFWEELGRTVASFGFVEEMLGKAIFALSGTVAFDPAGDPEAFNKWIETLKKALTDQLDGLIIAYKRALEENARTNGKNHSGHLADLDQARIIRNVLCHASWGKPDYEGRTVPMFVNRKLTVFDTPVDVEFLRQTRSALKEIVCDILDNVTSVGWKFPGSGSPGEQLWPHPAEISL